MARTYRRKHYTPSWVTETQRYFVDPRTGMEVQGGAVQLKGKERAAQLRWWHEDKGHWWGARPPKPHRMEHEQRHRAQARTELNRWRKDQAYEVSVLRKPKLDYWD